MTTTHSAGSAAGERLKRAREASGYDLSEASARMKLPVHALETLESGDWDRLGPPVFVRGHARSYARMLGICLDDEALPSPFTTTQIPSLVSHAHVPRYRYVAENLVRRAVYIVLTASLVVPVWLATRAHGDGATAVAPLDISPSQTSQVEPAVRTPMVASIASMPAATPAAAPVEIQFDGDSWVQLFDADGSIVEKGLMHAGQSRSVQSDAVSRLVLGNAAAVRLQVQGLPVDLAPYTRANVARFTLSSDGSLAPSAP
ncbi:helix-turn-helix domain-containing protein [Cognatilysobacter lacus]|uniref:Helix-turn-helix domain-containing protein n=1 Tax=Cognatilysobacter lacus TaxID=1643323 RepID=A0A5D8ZA02_9GAMM|nr:helix-turn-helix domain-containing protein [Lysobacter lacus]TZF91396.1 helix-turn-helix domain-containing protein [Lysobacter lacus]